MKKIISIALIALSIFALAACTPKEPAASVAVKDIMESIKAQVKTDLIAGGAKEDEFKDGKLPGYVVIDMLTAKDNPTVKLFNTEDIEEGTILQQNDSANLIIVVKAKDGKADAVKGVLAQVKTQQDTTWKDKAEQYTKVTANVTEAKDNYLIYSTYDDSTKIKGLFDKAFKTQE